MTWHDELLEGMPPGSRVVASEELVLAPEPRNVAVARTWVADRVPSWAPAEARGAIVLLTSELVTNGVVHARTELTVLIAVTDHDVLVGVHDLDLGHSELPGTDREGGRGLMIVRATASDFGQVHHLGGGKTTWFRVSA